MNKYLTKDQVKAILKNAPQTTTPDGIVKSLISQGYKLEGLNDTTPKEKPIFDFSGKGNTRIKDVIQEQGTKVVDAIGDQTKSPLQRGVQATAEAFNTIPKIAYQSAPKPVRSVLDTITEKVGKGFDLVTDKISDVPIVRDAALSGETTGLEDVLGTVGGTAEIAGNILGVEGAVTSATKVVKLTPKVAQEINNLAKNFTTKSEKQIESSILNNYSKGIKPTVAGKTSLSKDANYKANVIDAVKTIKENAPALSFTDDAGEIFTGQTPKTLQQLAESIDQTKKSIFNKYDSLAKEAGEAGVGVEMAPIANELDTVIGNQALSITNPTAIKYAQSLKERLLQTGKIDAQTAQDVIQNYNKSLEAFYRNPSYENASQAAIDSLIANKMRATLDEGITGLTGGQYGALKKQYGALKSIENDVVKAALRDARKNTKGLIDYTDIFSGGQVVSGILSLNPGQIASGITQKALAAFYKHLNNPNRAIEAMFKTADDLN